MLAVVVLGSIPIACEPPEPEQILRPYLPTTAHQAYGHVLAQTNLSRTALAQDWMSEAERALFEPAEIAVPFDDGGSFRAGEPLALGYTFDAERGRRVEIEVRIEAHEPLEVFVDLFRFETNGPKHVASAPPAPISADGPPVRRVEMEILEDSQYVLRVQPELLREGDYSVSIRSVAALEFPVEGMDTRAIQSGFGAERDGGRRNHHGVDIFAPRGTPALAAVDAVVARVQTTSIGGNVVWLQPLFGDLRLYYAHLDSHNVELGQYVMAGEVVGTVGNTGNARSTPPHLHFGVYQRRRGRRGGPADPYPFLK